MTISTYLTIIIKNVNRLNAPVERHSVAEWIHTPKQTLIYAAYKRLTSYLETHTG